MSDLKVTLVQSNPKWEDIPANLSLHESLISSLESDLIILPEMFQTGFSMNAATLAEPMNGSSMQWMQRQAQKLDSTIAATLIIKENEQYFNRLVWVDSSGRKTYYDKRHLFRMGKETETYTAGREQKTAQLNEWRFGLQTCYDLRFPVWSRNTSTYDCLVYCANWPSPRINAWRQLLIARAIENQAYVLGVNRVGTDPNGMLYTGQSMIVDYMGNVLAEGGNKESLTEATLSFESLKAYRSSFPVWKDQDDFVINT